MLPDGGGHALCCSSPSLLASKGLFKVRFCLPPGSPSMSQGGPCLGSPGAVSLRTNSVRSCAANTPAHGICRGALCGPCLPLDGLSGSSSGGALSLHLRMPSLGASYGGIPSMPVSFCGGGSFCGAHFGLCSLADEPSYGGDSSASSPCLHVPIDGTSRSGDSSGVLSLHHASLFAWGSNALGCAVVAFTALPASLMLAVPLVGAGVPFMSNDTPPGSCASTTTHSMSPMPAFPAAWTGPRPTPSGLSRGSLHRLGGLKDLR